MNIIELRGELVARQTRERNELIERHKHDLATFDAKANELTAASGTAEMNKMKNEPTPGQDAIDWAIARAASISDHVSAVVVPSLHSYRLPAEIEFKNGSKVIFLTHADLDDADLDAKTYAEFRFNTLAGIGVMESEWMHLLGRLTRQPFETNEWRRV